TGGPFVEKQVSEADEGVASHVPAAAASGPEVDPPVAVEHAGAERRAVARVAGQVLPHPAPAVILARAVWPLHHAMASAGANIARAGRDATAAKHRGLLLRLIAAYVHAINRAAHRIPIAVPAVEARLLRRQPQRIGRVQRRAVDVGVAVPGLRVAGVDRREPRRVGRPPAALQRAVLAHQEVVLIAVDVGLLAGESAVAAGRGEGFA